MSPSTSPLASLTARPEVHACLGGAQWAFRAPVIRVLSLCAGLEGEPFLVLARQVWLIGAGTPRQEGCDGWLTCFPTWEDFVDRIDVTELPELHRVLEAFFPWVAEPTDGGEEAERVESRGPFRE